MCVRQFAEFQFSSVCTPVQETEEIILSFPIYVIKAQCLVDIVNAHE